MTQNKKRVQFSPTDSVLKTKIKRTLTPFYRFKPVDSRETKIKHEKTQKKRNGDFRSLVTASVATALPKVTDVPSTLPKLPKNKTTKNKHNI